MAGGGTGNLVSQGGSNTYIPTVAPELNSTATTNNFNFTTAGTGLGYGFGPGAINFDQNNGWYSWSGNGLQSSGIAFIGDNLTGKYIPSSITTKGFAPGSPLDLDEAVSKVIQEANAKSGGIEELKKTLQDKQLYTSRETGAASLNQGAAFDPFFIKAVTNALMSATGMNAQIAASNPKAKLLSFNGFLANASPTGLYGSSPFGTKRDVVHQKFKPEEFEIVIDQLFQQTIGRGASKEELDDFVTKLQGYEKKNPQVSITTSSEGGSTRTQSGGVSGNEMEAMMRDQALANPEAESYNKATKYLTYFMEALDSPIELGN